MPEHSYGLAAEMHTASMRLTPRPDPPVSLDLPEPLCNFVAPSLDSAYECGRARVGSVLVSANYKALIAKTY